MSAPLEVRLRQPSLGHSYPNLDWLSLDEGSILRLCFEECKLGVGSGQRVFGKCRNHSGPVLEMFTAATADGGLYNSPDHRRGIFGKEL